MNSKWMPLLLCDFYKISHRNMYPKGTEFVYSTWIPRESRMKNVDHVVAFGFQAFIKEYLIEYFNENFFGRDKDTVLAEYSRIIHFTLGIEVPETDHIAALWDLGYLPLEIRAVAEGTKVPLRVPMLTIENTDPRFFWLTNALETLMSAELWQPSTSATIAFEYKSLFDKFALRTTGSTDGTKFQGHDFSLRGMEGVRAGAASGAGHLLSFEGSDTIPAILFLEEFYGANVETETVGTSIPATEHSVMCAYGQDEYTSFKRLITEIHPDGFISIVSDTWNLWNVLTVTMPALKDVIVARNGRVVVRPDSGDPADIICGTRGRPGHESDTEEEKKGVVELLWETFGGVTNELGYMVLDSHVGAIYGDSITLERAEDILTRLEEKGFASTNIVLGIGSFTYQYQTRDTFGFALKSTWVQILGKALNIFKDPWTDKKKVKKSLTGRVVVLDGNDGLHAVDNLSVKEAEDYSDDLLVPIFRDGRLLVETTLAQIRERVAA
jgi:nicotinamide phosphoribosyltransferase